MVLPEASADRRCSRCGKDCDKRVAAVHLAMQSKHGDDLPYLRAQAGRYQVGRLYMICMECYLAVMGVEPEQGERME